MATLYGLSPLVLMILAGGLLVVFGLGLLVGLWVAAARDASDRGANGRSGRERDRDGDAGELYVGNLSYETTKNDVQKAFEEYGKVLSVRLIQNRVNGKSKGYGFVDMGNHDECLAAIEGLHGTQLKGRQIVVNEAKSRRRG